MPMSPDISPPVTRPLPDARATLAILKGRKTLEGERMRRTRAAAAASAVNLKQRCGACKTCMNMLAGQRRYECLTQRMKAAALAGHAGAQLAVCQEDALGARVRVWWDGDATFYPGVVAHYDAVSTEHTVCYDDGEVGMHKLWWVWLGVERSCIWETRAVDSPQSFLINLHLTIHRQHDERILLDSPVEEWPTLAEMARQRLRQAHEMLMDRKRQARCRSRGGGLIVSSGLGKCRQQSVRSSPHAEWIPAAAGSVLGGPLDRL